MRPIRQALLPSAVTIYNKFKDPDTGKVSFYKKHFKHTRIMTTKSSFAMVANSGPMRVYNTELWLDPVTSILANDTSEVPCGETFLKLLNWESEDNKSDFWTLQEGDYLLEGNCELEPSIDFESKILKLRPYKINEIALVRQKDGSTHHWELILV